MSIFVNRFKLAAGAEGLGLGCTPEDGVRLAGVKLLRKTASGFEPRRKDEIAALMQIAYGADTSAERVSPSLELIAKALDQGDLASAMIATLHLKLPDVDSKRAENLVRADRLLAKYDPNEPRDRRGRWTTGNGARTDGSPGRAPDVDGEASGSAGADLVRPIAHSAFLGSAVFHPDQPLDLTEISGRSFSQATSWSPPSRAASPGQYGTAWQGAAALQAAYASGTGATYWVDPKTMQMENAIDIGDQIQQSVNNGGFMRGVLDQAIASGQAVQFNSAKWNKTGLLRFDDGPLMPDGQTVGRFGGFVMGTLTATPKGAYSVMGTIVPINTNPFSYDLDASSPAGNAGILFGGLVPDIHNGFRPNSSSKPFRIKFNRVLNFNVTGSYGSR